MGAERYEFKVSDKKALTRVKNNLFYIRILFHCALKFQRHCLVAFAPIFKITVVNRRKIIINSFYIYFVFVIINNIKEFCNMIFMAVREIPACNNGLSAACELFKKFNYSDIIVYRIHMCAVNDEKAAVAAADYVAHAAVNQRMVNLKLPERGLAGIYTVFGGCVIECSDRVGNNTHFMLVFAEINMEHNVRTVGSVKIIF